MEQSAKFNLHNLLSISIQKGFKLNQNYDIPAFGIYVKYTFQNKTNLILQIHDLSDCKIKLVCTTNDFSVIQIKTYMYLARPHPQFMIPAYT